MKRAYRAANLQDAHILLSLLAQAGVAARILNGGAVGAVGDIPFVSAYPEIWVEHDLDYARARELVGEWERTPARPAGADEQRCPACGETCPPQYALCWKCGAVLA